MNGLIYAYMLDGNGSARALTPREALSHAAAQGAAGLLWMHMDYAEPEVQQWLAEESGVDPLIAEALVEEGTRPRCLQQGQGLLLVLRGMNHNPGADPEDMVALRILIEPGRIITTRQRRFMSVEHLRQSLEAGVGPRNTGDFVTHITERTIDHIGEIVDEVDERVDELEVSVIGNPGAALRSELSDSRRQIITLRRYIAPQRETLMKLSALPLSWLEEPHRAQIRESAEKTVRYIEDLDSARERAAITHEELLSMHSEKAGSTMYLLSIVAAVFLPLGFLTGLLGINVGGIPGADSPTAFYLVCAILIGIGVAELLIFRFNKWL